jgi:hypothetical protein
MSGRARRATRPTPCLFGASLGLAPTAAFRARMWTHARGAALPFGSLGLASGNTRSRAGVPGASTTIRQGIPRYEGKAAPTRATLHRARSGKRPFSAVEKSLDRSRSSETILQFSVFTISCFDDFQIRDFSDFDRATIAKRSRPSRVGAQRSADNFDHPLFNHSDDPPLSARRPTAADGRHDECAESQPPRS